MLQLLDAGYWLQVACWMLTEAEGRGLVAKGLSLQLTAES
jgi:hypothetical protein